MAQSRMLCIAWPLLLTWTIRMLLLRARSIAAGVFAPEAIVLSPMLSTCYMLGPLVIFRCLGNAMNGLRFELPLKPKLKPRAIAAALDALAWVMMLQWLTCYDEGALLVDVVRGVTVMSRIANRVRIILCRTCRTFLWQFGW